MASRITLAQIDHGLAALKLAQLLGEEDGEAVPMPGKVTMRQLSEYCGVSISTVAALERMALMKIAIGLTGSIPPHLLDEPDSGAVDVFNI